MFFIIGIAAAIVASGIGPLTEEEEFLPKEHELMTLISVISNDFPSSEEAKDRIVVNINWGIKDLDREDTSAWDPESLGTLIWDDSFNLAPAKNQEALIDLCKDLRDTNELVQESRVTCWILDMQDYVDAGASCASGQKMPLGDEATFDKCLKAFLTTEKGIDH